jgi:hypothetical protein
MATAGLPYVLQEQDFDSISGGRPYKHINQMVVIVNSSDQEVTQEGGSWLTVITNNVTRVDKPIGKPVPD